MRQAARTDDNHQEIIDALRKVGCSVLDLSRVGSGAPDIAAGRMDINGVKHNYLIEIKNSNKPPSQRKLTPDQVKFHADWKGQINTVKSVDEALDLVLNIKR